jgi:hypothetical protein
VYGADDPDARSNLTNLTYDDLAEHITKQNAAFVEGTSMMVWADFQSVISQPAPLTHERYSSIPRLVVEKPDNFAPTPVHSIAMAF